MSPAVVALCLVVIVIGGTLVILWASIDTESELESRPLGTPPQPRPRDDYVGARRYGGPMPDQDRFRPPEGQRISWLGGDDTRGWQWQSPDDQERPRRNL